MPQRAQSAPVRRRPPNTSTTATTTHTHNAGIKHPPPAHLNLHYTPSQPPQRQTPRQQQQQQAQTLRTARSARNTLLDDFTTKFIKTRNELHAKNQQCEALAVEIDKYKKELIQAHEILSSLEHQKFVLVDQYEESKQRHQQEINHHRSLTQELTQSRKEKQDRLKERLFLAQELHAHQLMYKQMYEDNVKLEEQAKSLSRKLQGVNKERLKFRQECIDNQAQMSEYNAQLEQLQLELKEMKDVVTNSIGDSLHSQHTPHRTQSSPHPPPHTTPRNYSPHHTPYHSSQAPYPPAASSKWHVS